MTWITTVDVWLTEDQSMNNAQLVADFFGESWTPNAIAAMCGNMRKESSINPNIYEFGYNHSLERGYGLTQWTPATKLMNWCTSNYLDWSSGDSQLARIAWELANEGNPSLSQWIKKAPYNMSFSDFSQSTESVDYLTEVFCWSYERPNATAGAQSMPERVAFANRVYNEVSFEGGSEGTGKKYLPPYLWRRKSTMRRRA